MPPFSPDVLSSIPFPLPDLLQKGNGLTAMESTGFQTLFFILYGI